MKPIQSCRLRLSASPVLALCLCCILQVLAMRADAKVSLPALFKDHMVMQRDTQVTVWGWADPKEQVFVTLGSFRKSITAGNSGQWKVTLGPFPAGGPYQLQVRAGNTITVSDILFGEVWVCGGQSNMQFTLDMLGIKPAEALPPKAQQIRFFNVQVNVDILPARDVKAGYWEIADASTIGHLSGTAYYFARYLYDSLQVPIGLISSNLGATSIETWMSENALRAFPQFTATLDRTVQSGKNVETLLQELAIYRQSWDTAYYLNSPGIEQKWYLPETDISDWVDMQIPGYWENIGYEKHDGEGWFRREFDKPANATGDSFNIALNQVDDYDIAWLNGVKIGESFGSRNWRNYYFSTSLLKEKGNVLVVRVFDIGGKGGMYTNAFWGNPILNGTWKFKKGRGIKADIFPVPEVPNASFFTHPTVLYNANIAPLTQYRIKGVIWYQGESNDQRGEEYGKLLPALIQDWRRQWKQPDLAFLVVQLANHHAVAAEPAESNWAELRASQMEALKLPKTAIASAIDIGDANDIHPRDKQTLGKRLALAALAVAYDKAVPYRAPEFENITIKGSKAQVSFKLHGTHLTLKDPKAPIRGFALAGKDGRYYWAKAALKHDKITLSAPEVPEPVSVRYAWSDNPGPLNLYSKEGLPLLPFRSDTAPFSSAGKVFEFDEGGF